MAIIRKLNGVIFLLVLNDFLFEIDAMNFIRTVTGFFLGAWMTICMLNRPQNS